MAHAYPQAMASLRGTVAFQAVLQENQQRGARARQVGASAEQHVAQAVDRWTQTGLCALTPGHPGMRYLGQWRGRPVFEPKGKGTVDWTGTIGGVAVAFDVKATGSQVFRASERTLPLHELAFLQTFADAGGLAFLLVCENAHTQPRWHVQIAQPARVRAQPPGAVEVCDWPRISLGSRGVHDLPDLVRYLRAPAARAGRAPVGGGA